MPRLAFALLAIAALLPTAAPAIQLGGDPGPVFDMPGHGDYYHWEVDMTGMTPGDILVDFTVNVPVGGAELSIFQVFGACDADTYRYRANFDLFLNGAPFNWTSVEKPFCYYHDLADQILPEGPTDFLVRFAGADNAPPPGFDFADVRFSAPGGIVPAIPLPGAMACLLGGVGMLTIGRERRRTS